MSKNNYTSTSSVRVKNKLVPELRFPEFKKSGEWDYLNGDEIFEPISNKNHNSDLPILAITQEYGAIPRDMIDYNISVTDKSIESYKVVEVGDFIISLRSFQGGIEYSNYLGLCSPAYIVLRKKIDVENDFYRHYFKSNSFIRDLNKNLEGIRDGKMVSYDQFSEILLPKPIPKEQQKIADCLSSLDDLITAENQKLESLKTQKKGLMQNLFPAEGEKVPKLRFPEFINDAEWDEDIVENLISIITPPKKLTSSNYLVKGEYPIIDQSKSFYCGWTNDKDAIISKSFPLIIFGDHTCILKIAKEPFAQGADGIKIIKSNELIEEEYLYQYLQHNAVKQEEYKRHFSILKEKIVLFPCIKTNEQQKIADCLSSLDDLITAQSQKIEALKEHKKGLMQGLFPNSKGVN